MQPSSIACEPRVAIPTEGYCGPGPARTFRSLMAVATMSAWARPALPTTIAPARNRFRFKVISFLLVLTQASNVSGADDVPLHWLSPVNDCIDVLNSNVAGN